MEVVTVARIDFSNSSNLIFMYEDGVADNNLWPRKQYPHFHIRNVWLYVSIELHRQFSPPAKCGQGENWHAKQPMGHLIKSVSLGHYHKTRPL